MEESEPSAARTPDVRETVAIIENPSGMVPSGVEAILAATG
jgi:hypothetical protein